MRCIYLSCVLKVFIADFIVLVIKWFNVSYPQELRIFHYSILNWIIFQMFSSTQLHSYIVPILNAFILACSFLFKQNRYFTGDATPVDRRDFDIRRNFFHHQLSNISHVRIIRFIIPFWLQNDRTFQSDLHITSYHHNLVVLCGT